MNKKTLTKYESDDLEFSVEVDSNGFFLTEKLSTSIDGLRAYHAFLGEVIHDNGLDPVVKNGQPPTQIKRVPSQFAAEDFS